MQQQNYSYVLKGKKIADDLRLQYNNESIFYFNSKLLTNQNIDIQNIAQNKKYFINFVANVHDLLNTGIKTDISVLDAPNNQNIQIVMNTTLLNLFSDRIKNEITTELSQCRQKYLAIYQNCVTLDDFGKANDTFMYMGDEPLYDKDPEKSKKILESEIIVRKEQLAKCTERTYDPTYKKINDLNPTTGNVNTYCNDVIWGTEMLGDECGSTKTDDQVREIVAGIILANYHRTSHIDAKILANSAQDLYFTIRGKYFSPDELYVQTFDPAHKQMVFGYSRHIAKYKNCPKYFICGTMKRPLLGTKSCAEYVDWSRKLNTMYTSCALFNDNNFIRFVMPPDRFLPQKRYDQKEEVTDFQIFNKLPVAVMITKFVDERDKLHPTQMFIHYLFYDTETDITYKTTYEMGSIPTPTRIKIYDFYKKEIVLGQIWHYTLVTYNELNILLKYNVGVIKEIFRSKKYPHILFLSKNSILESNYNKMDLEKIDFKHVTIIINGRRFECWQLDHVPSHDIDTIYADALKNKKIYAYKKLNSDEYIIIDVPITNNNVATKLNVEYSKGSPNRIIYHEKPSGSRLSFSNLQSQKGGALILKNKSESKTPGFFDLELINYDLFKKFSKLNISSQNLKPDEKEYYNISRYYDPHILVDAVNLSSRRTKTSIIHTADREYRSVENTIDSLLNLKLKYKFLTLYRPFTDKFFNRYEIYSNFDMIKNNTNVIIFGHSSLSDVEAIEYYKLANDINNIKIKVIVHPDVYLLDYKTIKQKIKHLQGYFDFEYVEDAKLFDIQTYPKVDLFVDDYVIRPLKNQAYDEYFNLKLKFAAVLTALKNLQTGGSFVFFVMNILLKTHADLIIIAREFFETYHLYNYEIQAKYKLIYCVVVFTGFKGISAAKYDELHNMYSQIGSSGPDIMNTKEDIVPLDTFIYSYVDVDINNKLYNEFRDFNDNVFRDKINFLQQCKNAVENPKLLTNIVKDAIFTSFTYAKKYNFDILDIIHIDPNDNFIINIFYDMFFETRSTKYMFINNEEFNDARIPDFEVNQITLYPHQVLLDNLMARDHSHIKLLERAIDTRNIIEWDKHKEAVRYYRPHVKFNKDLRKLVMHQYNTGPNSQAWLKMYEILAAIPLINKNSTTLRTFHICEAPGSFISAINHFIKTRTKIKNFEWIANSLNPKKSTSKNTAFGDDYGYMKKYPNNWDFGADNTGDITHQVNMDHYKNKIKNVNLITSDCGIPWEKESAKVHELLKIHLAEMILIMYVLPIDADFVAKMIFPLYRPIEIDLMYTLYNSFTELIFYKPKINIFSKEFYVIGRGYKGVDPKIMTKMRSLLTKFDHNARLHSQIPQSFIYQLATVNHKMCTDYIFNFKKQVYYVENNKELGEDFITYMKIILKEKNDEWCKDTKIKKINSADRL